MVAFLAGCATYAPAPTANEMVAIAQSPGQLDAAAVRYELARLAPDYTWDGATWNNLTLFAAARASSPAVREARAALATAEADTVAARQAPGPTLTLSAEYAVDAPESSPWLFGVAADTLLDIGGRRRGRLASADLALRKAGYDYAASLWAVRAGIARSVIALHFAQQEADTSFALVDTRQRQFGVVERQVGAGQVSRATLERVRSDLSLARSRSLAAKSAQTQARLQLASMIGVSSNAFSDAAIEISPPARGMTVEPDAQAIDAALAARSDILVAMADYDRADASYRTAVASQYPELRIAPGYTWERGLTKLPIGLSLGFPSWDLNAAAIQAAEAARQQAGDALEAVVANARAGVEIAAAEHRAAIVALDEVRTQSLLVAERLARQADNEIAAGRIDRGDWAAGQAGLVSARLEVIAAERRVANAQVALEDALRTPLSGPETLIAAPQAVETESNPR